MYDKLISKYPHSIPLDNEMQNLKIKKLEDASLNALKDNLLTLYYYKSIQYLK